MVAQAGRDALDVSTMQPANSRIPQQGHDERSLSVMHQALVLAEGDILGAMQPVFNGPTPRCDGDHLPTVQQREWVLLRRSGGAEMGPV